MSVYKDSRPGRKKPWVVDITDPQLGPTGRKKEYFRTRTEADAFHKRLSLELADGTYAERQRRAASRQTLAQWWPKYKEALQTGATPRGVANADKTVTVQESRWRCHLEPELGHVYLEDIQAPQIQHLKVRLAKKELSTHTRNRVLGLLRNMLNVAVEWGHIPGRPRIALLKVTQDSLPDFLSERELQAFLDQVVEPEWRAMVLVAARCGLRKGELRALRWIDVDLKAGVLRIAQNFSAKQQKSTKGGKPRVVPLVEDVAVELQQHPRRLDTPYVWPGDTDEDGRVQALTENQMTNVARRWQRQWAALGLGEQLDGGFFKGWHSLRDTAASHWVADGIDLRTVQKMGGWKDLKTLERYAHLLPDALDVARSKMEARIRRGAGAAPGDSETTTVNEDNRRNRT